ncbi:MAG: ATP-binding protein [Alphaproteobacteria bacterium]
MSLRMTTLRKIVAIFAISSGIAVGLVGLFIDGVLEKIALDRWRADHAVLALVLADHVDKEIAAALNDLVFMSRLPQFASFPAADRIDPALNGLPQDLEPEKRRILETLRNKDNRFSVLFLALPDGRFYIHHPYSVQLTLKTDGIAERSYFREARTTKEPVISDSFVGANGMLVTVIDVPILNADGAIVAHLGGVFYLDQLSRLVDRFRIGRFETGFIVDQNGRLIAHTDTTFLQGEARNSFQNSPVVAAFLRHEPDVSLGGVQRVTMRSEVDPVDGGEHLVAFVPLRAGWGLGLTRHRAGILAETRPDLWRAVALVGGILALVGGIGVAASLSLGRRWDAAERQLREAHDEMEGRIERRTAELADANDRLRTEIDERGRAEAALAERERVFRAIFDNAFQFINVLRSDGTMVEVNRTVLDFADVRPQEVVGRPFWTAPWLSSSPEQQQSLRQAITRAAGGHFVRMEVIHVGARGGVHHVDFSLNPVFDTRGVTALLIAEGRDVTERKAAEQVVRDLNAELERRVEERTRDLRDQIAERARVEENLRRSHELLDCVTRLQAHFINEDDLVPLFDRLLHDILRLTGSSFGFIAELVEDEAKGRCLVGLAISDIAWNEESRGLFRERGPGGRRFCDLDRLYGQAVLTGEPVIANDPETHPAWRGLPEGHPSIQAFLGVPLYRGGAMIGAISLANRAGGYDMDIVTFMRPVLTACAQVIDAYRNLREWDRDQEDLRLTLERLSRSNEELERFAYIASHDLQEPLRSISRFSQLLHTRYAGRLDAEADEIIGYVVDGAKHMNALIRDLLAYSRVNAAPAPRVAVNLGWALGRALESLAVPITDTGADITSDPLPTLPGDEGQLAQVFSQLLDNAIRFRSPDRPPRIHVGAEHRDDHWLISVEDNGIGIDRRYFDQIFVIFRRLHTRDAYPGTGVGLAIVKRIVELHGGSVSVDSEPDRGTAIRFTLPHCPVVEAGQSGEEENAAIFTPSPPSSGGEGY